MSENFDFNIDNYSTDNLISFFRLHNNYDFKDLDKKDLAEYGLFCLDDMRITLRSADADIMESTLRHEMMHAAFAIGGIAHCKPFEDMEEGAVRCLENIFFPAWERVVAKPKRKTKCTKNSSSQPITTVA